MKKKKKKDRLFSDSIRKELPKKPTMVMKDKRIAKLKKTLSEDVKDDLNEYNL